jgi:hypothetical protein
MLSFMLLTVREDPKVRPPCGCADRDVTDLPGGGKPPRPRARGRARVALVGRGRPGQGTSFGNAGIIEREAVTPYPFLRDVRTLLAAIGRAER